MRLGCAASLFQILLCFLKVPNCWQHDSVALPAWKNNPGKVIGFELWAQGARRTGLIINGLNWEDLVAGSGDSVKFVYSAPI
jgi:hypothetical protein